MASDHATPPTLTIDEKIVAQANGLSTSEAAAIIVTETIHGRLLDAAPLLWEDDRMAEIDWDTYRNQIGHLSGGERRVFELADSLATGRPVDLRDALAGLDHDNSQRVLEAIAHALHLSGSLR